MSCPASAVVASGERERNADSLFPGAESPLMSPRHQRRRRHSSYQTFRRHSTELFDSETVYLKVDIFLSTLGRRLNSLESYGELKFDESIDRAYSTLEAIHESCSTVSGELMDAGRRRAKLVVEILELRYQEALAKKLTLESKAQASMKLMEGFLTDMENRAQALRDAGLSGVVEGGWRRAESSLKTARGAVGDGMVRARQAKEVMKLRIQHAIQRAREQRLIHINDLPDPWKNNPHILKGYRFCETKLDCVRSAFYLSNELVNIWSHALGLVVVLSIAFYFYPTSANFPLLSNTDIFFTAVFFAAAAKCLVCSTMWHTMNSISDQTLMERFACVDYTGISLLIGASIITTEYAAFYCEPWSRWTYIIMTSVFALGGLIVPWHPFFNREDMAWARVAFYVSLGATGFLPVIQLNLYRGFAWTYYFYAPVWKSVVVYVLGAVIYASKVPEKFVPGWFDYIGGSHNIWHFAVLGGILFHYSAMYDMFAGAYERAATECLAY